VKEMAWVERTLAGEMWVVDSCKRSLDDHSLIDGS